MQENLNLVKCISSKENNCRVATTHLNNKNRINFQNSNLGPKTGLTKTKNTE